jgi:hypothetical protein
MEVRSAMTWVELVGNFGGLVLGALALLGVAAYIYASRRTTDAADSSDDHWRYRKP